MEMFRRTYAEINLENLAHNWHAIQKVAGDNRFICPMVKANAYGHGDAQVSMTLEKEGAQALGVCLIEEGLQLRASGVKCDILVFRGFDRRGAEKMLEYQLTPVVSTWEQIHTLEAVADEPVKVHLKFNTGMGRLGFDPDQSQKLDEHFANSKKLKLKAILSHFAVGEDSYLSSGLSARQTEQMAELVRFFRHRDIYAHLLNTGGIGGLAKLRAGAVEIAEANHELLKYPWGFRPGLMLYGYQPASHFKEIDLRAVMSLKSVVNNIRHVQVGESVSYGATWVAQRPSKVAVIPIGYADGVHRLVSNRASVLLAEQRVPIIGRVCMDFLMLDVTDVVGDDSFEKWTEEEVVIFGYDQKNNFLSAEEQSLHSDTITWETLTSVSARVPRHFRGLKKS